MGFSRYPTITDELLSAYIDDAVNAAERAAIEEAAANDSEIAWRLESLQHTVSMLGQLTDVPLPRSFALNEALVEAALAENHSSQIVRPRAVEAPDSLWNKWLDFWRSGSPIWRNAAAACALLLVVVLVGGSIVVQHPISSQQSEELVAVHSAEIRASLEQTTSATAPVVTDTDGEAASASIAMAPESTAVRTDQAGSEAQPMELAQNADGQSMLRQDASSTLAQDADLAEGDSAEAEPQVERSIVADAATTGMALQEEPSAIPAPLAAPSVLSSESMVADVEIAPVSASISDPDSLEGGRDLAADEIAENAIAEAAPDADLLIAAAALEMRATLPSEGDVTEDSVAGNDVANEDGVVKTAEAEITETLPAQPSDDEPIPLEAEAMPDAMALAAVDLAEPAATSEATATTQPDADQESNAESAPEEAVTREASDAEAPQDQDQQGDTDSAQPSTVAMADIAQDAGPAPEAVPEAALEVSSKPDPSGPSSTDDAAAQPLAKGVETVINSMSPLGMLAIVLAILTLVFFSMWLRSRSTTATRSP